MAGYLHYRNRRQRLFVGFILLVGLCNWLFPEDASALRRKTSSNRECAICHIMWLDDFKREDLVPLIPYDPLPEVESGRQDVASTDQMCFSCHDGFVLDSRFLWKTNRHNHPVGVKPSDDVTIPTVQGKTIFPMNEDGKLYCGSCHSAHGIDWKEKQSSTIFMRMESRNSNLCTACHLNRVTGPEKGNHPIHKKLKELPPSLIKAGSRFSNKGEVICESCHLVHGSKQKRMLAKPNHNSDLCSSCHTRQEQVRNTKHDLAIVAPDALNARDHTATEAGPCSACHIPHKARGPVLWSRSVLVSKDLGSAYCLNCHKSNGIAGHKAIDEFSHPVDVPLRKVGIIAKKDGWLGPARNMAAPKNLVQLPLFDISGKPAQEGGNVTCLSCHDPHQWSADHSKQAPSEIRDADGDGSNSFLRIANDKGSALCLNCHLSQAPVVVSKHNLDIAAPDETNRDGMNVFRSGVCSSCHLPHNGTGKNMWARILTENRQDNATKCVNCHSRGQVAEHRTPGEYSHPLHVNLDKLGTTTDLPLFNHEGEQDDKLGHIECTTCHDPHQWDPTNEIARSGINPEVEGDASNSFLRKRASGSATLCIDCHDREKSVIGTDHDLAVTAPDSLNILKQKVKHSGTCGQCHGVHNADGTQNLWIQPLGNGKDEAARICSGCHSQSGVAHAKVPLELEHPRRILSANAARLRQDDKVKFIPPLFKSDGKPTDAGMVSCLTCHDPHRWSANQPESGSGENLEGDIRNSFLRHGSSEYFICADCHGQDSLYRYKYFHWPKSRPDTELDL